MAKTAPISVRLEPETDALIRDIAANEGRSRSAVAARLLEESARMRRFPGIAFRDGSMGRRAYVQGSHLDVWQIVEGIKSIDELEELGDATHLTRQQVELAYAYYEAYPDEVDRMIAENQISLEEVRRRYPGLVIEEFPIK